MRHQIRIDQRFEAPIEEVFEAITDHAGMVRWTSAAEVTVEEPGEPAPNGLGALRRIRWRGISVWERVVGWDVPTRMEYSVERGSPVRDHLGTFRLEAVSDRATHVDYRIDYRVPWIFGGPLVGALLKRVLGGDLRQGLARLARMMAEERSSR